MTETQPGGSPTVLRMILARQLQALREKAGMSYEQAAQAIYSSEWTIRRMERAEGGLKPLTVILRSSVRTPRAYTYRAHTRTDDHLTQPGERLMVTMSNRARCPPGRPGTARPRRRNARLARAGSRASGAALSSWRTACWSAA